MKIKCKPKEEKPLVIPITYNDFGRAYARTYRYGKWGRVFCVQCPHCEEYIGSPFRKGYMWELPDLILRNKVECSICAVTLQLTSKYIIIKEKY